MTRRERGDVRRVRAGDDAPTVRRRRDRDRGVRCRHCEQAHTAIIASSACGAEPPQRQAGEQEHERNSRQRATGRRERAIGTGHASRGDAHPGSHEWECHRAARIAARGGSTVDSTEGVRVRRG